MPVNCWISDFIFSCLSLAAGFFKDDLQGAWSKFSKRIWPSLGMIALLFGLVFLGQIFSNLLMGILYQIVNLTKEKGLNQATVERLLTNRQSPAISSGCIFHCSDRSFCRRISLSEILDGYRKEIHVYSPYYHPTGSFICGNSHARLTNFGIHQCHPTVDNSAYLGNFL